MRTETVTCDCQKLISEVAHKGSTKKSGVLKDYQKWKEAPLDSFV